ncbi:hypothetical protein WOLCODRAFT_118043, partial [Wolfiporia cocos MD-104 SS10]
MQPSTSGSSDMTSRRTQRAGSVGSSSSASGISASISAPGRPSSARPPSSASIRPSVSAPLRPTTNATPRPASSASSTRPASSASTRSMSRLTQRSASRFAQRSSRQLRLLPYYQSLATQVAGISVEDDPERFRSVVEHVSKSLDQTVRPSMESDMDAVKIHIRGHAQKARVNSNDALATALETAQRKLDEQIQQHSDLDSELKVSRIPNHIQLLLLLSQPPSSETLRAAEEYLIKANDPPEQPPGLTWKDILAEEPFEGQHWEGAYGLPPGSTVENWDNHSHGSTPSLSPWDDSDLDDSFSSSGFESAETPLRPPRPVPKEQADDLRRPLAAYSHLQDVENLQARQYWRSDWRTDAVTTRPFDIGDASTLERGHLVQRYIHEHDAVREVLMGLQGHNNMMMEWIYNGKDAFSYLPTTTVRLLHLSAAAQTSILTSFTTTATVLEHLRKFVHAVYSKAWQTPPQAISSKHAHFYRRSTLTLEAFSAAVDSQIRSFQRWCAEKEEEICLAAGGIGPPIVVSLLSLDKAIRDRFSATFSAILDVLRSISKRVVRNPDPSLEIWTMPDLPLKVSPSAFAAILLDSLLDAAQDNISMGDDITSQALMSVFIDTAEPIWNMIGRWMKDGMPVQDMIKLNETQLTASLDDEFFIEDNEMPMLDPDFWSDGFMLREGPVDEGDNRPSSVPTFLQHAARIVLDAGKAIGLLRALGVGALFDQEAEQQWMAKWRSFRALMESPSGLSPDEDDLEDTTGQVKSVIMSTNGLSRHVYDELLPHNDLAQQMLQQVLVDDCELWSHLSAMEGLYLMERGDTMSRFVDVLFARMDNQQAWNDFHFLNSAFRDVLTSGSDKWIDAALVRFSHRGSRDKHIAWTIRAVDGLFIEYAVPFPLTYIFGPRAMQVYSSVFAFLLQIHRAKSVLDRILVRGDVLGVTHAQTELKVLYAIRSKLSWFVNTLLSFVATNVLHAQLLRFHTQFSNARSLNEMIQLHDEHLTKIEGRCLLQKNTSALHRAILSILDMSLHFSAHFVSLAGDTTHDLSRHSTKLTRHRSRRRRAARRDVVAFSGTQRDPASSSSDEDEEEDGAEPSISMSMAVSSMLGEDGDGDGANRLERMAGELDALVRFVRRGAESLAAGAGEAAAVFGVFAFQLEDWDR